MKSLPPLIWFTEFTDVQPAVWETDGGPMDPKAEDPLPDVATTFDPMPQASNRMGRNMCIYIYDSRYIHFKICLIYINFYTYTYTLRAHHQECIFHMRMRPQKRALVAAPFEHKPTDSQTNSPLPNCEETNCNGLCLGRHVARKQARGVEPIKTPCGQTPRRPRYPKLLLLKPACK